MSRVDERRPTDRDMSRPDLRWLLDDLVDHVAGIEQAVVLSADGLLLARSVDVAPGAAKHLSAVASAFHRLAQSASPQLRGGSVQRTVVEMDDLVLLVTVAGTGVCLAVVATAEAPLGTVAYETGLLVTRVGSAL